MFGLDLVSFKSMNNMNMTLKISFNPGLYFNSWSEPIFSASVYRHGDVSATWIGIHSRVFGPAFISNHFQRVCFFQDPYVS